MANDRNHFIATLDIWDVDIAYKAREIKTFTRNRLKHKANDREFAWVEDKKRRRSALSVCMGMGGKKR